MYSKNQHKQEDLFSIPHQGGTTKYALDEVREMEHRGASRGLRPGAEAKAVIPRMSVIDTFSWNLSKLCYSFWHKSYHSRLSKNLTKWINEHF